MTADSDPPDKSGAPQARCSLREVRITQALAYPFLRKNCLNALILPGLISLVVIWLIENQLNSAALYFATLVAVPCLMGYGWRLMEVLREGGYDTQAPEWTLEAVPATWWDGLKLMPILLTMSFYVAVVPGLVSLRADNAVNALLDSPVSAIMLRTWISLPGSLAILDRIFVEEEASPKTSKTDWVHADLAEIVGEYKTSVQGVQIDQRAPLVSDASKSSMDFTARGAADWRSGQLTKAIEDCSHAITISPTDATAHTYRGATYHEQGRYKDAIRDYTKAISIDPNNPRAYRLRGCAYHDHRQYRGVIDDFSKAIGIDANNALDYVLRADAYNKLGQYEKAVADCTQAMSLDPNLAAAYSVRSSAYSGLAKQPEASADISQEHELDPEFTDHVIGPGCCVGHYSKRSATYWYQQWMMESAQDRNEPDDMRARYYDELGEYQNAADEWTKEINRFAAKSPKLAGSFLINRGNDYDRLGQYQQAIDDYTKAINAGFEHTPEAAVYLRRGGAHSKLGQYQNAVEDYSQAISSGGDNAWLYEQRGDAYRKLGQRQNMIDDYSRTIILTPEYGAPLKQFLNHGIVGFEVFCTILFALLMPFALGAIIQSAGTRSFSQLMNITRIHSAGRRCYRKAMLVAVALCVIFALYSLLVYSLTSNPQEMLLYIAGPIFVVAMFASFHLAAQAFDNYRQDNLPPPLPNTRVSLKDAALAACLSLVIVNAGLCGTLGFGSSPWFGPAYDATL